ncbi:helix-turn-helix domain-containing protein [Chryseobacterium sp. MEBOG07]|uniref:helix-turn-helix domain-containing protein n=1 Tax=Chryseobacterium sp. MEBOG07 TaxID=2879939 RepID=UPI001F3708E9|nr:helix-turn-helix domain-containing protein [Chryseobacterium sp. MEBOG07]UKB78331.1 helix-turn-helix domain-containing protein [Chryseobacterium sp. MEBOG07]
MKTPNYKKIYQDIISKNYPEGHSKFKKFLKKDILSTIDVINLDKLIFSNSDLESEMFNQKHRAYDFNAIVHIIDYQEKNNLSNTQTAMHFKLSRNTISKWKKFLQKSHN